MNLRTLICLFLKVYSWNTPHSTLSTILCSLSLTSKDDVNSLNSQNVIIRKFRIDWKQNLWTKKWKISDKFNNTFKEDGFMKVFYHNHIFIHMGKIRFFKKMTYSYAEKAKSLSMRYKKKSLYKYLIYKLSVHSTNIFKISIETWKPGHFSNLRKSIIKTNFRILNWAFISVAIPVD